jgi:hypothetical protein
MKKGGFGKPASAPSCHSYQYENSSLANPRGRPLRIARQRGYVKSTRVISSPANQLAAALPSLARDLMCRAGGIELPDARSRIPR